MRVILDFALFFFVFSDVFCVLRGSLFQRFSRRPYNQQGPVGREATARLIDEERVHDESFAGAYERFRRPAQRVVSSSLNEYRSISQVRTAVILPQRQTCFFLTGASARVKIIIDILV